MRPGAILLEDYMGRAFCDPSQSQDWFAVNGLSFSSTSLKQELYAGRTDYCVVVASTVMTIMVLTQITITSPLQPRSHTPEGFKYQNITYVRRTNSHNTVIPFFRPKYILYTYTSHSRYYGL